MSFGMQVGTQNRIKIDLKRHQKRNAKKRDWRTGRNASCGAARREGLLPAADVRSLNEKSEREEGVKRA